MNRPISAIDAIAPAIQRARTILFRPVDPGKWLILGFLTFLQTLGGGERYGELRFPIGSWKHGDWSWTPRRPFGWILEWMFPQGHSGGEGRGASFFRADAVDWADCIRSGSWWFTHHPALTGGLVFIAVLVVLALVVLFVWLSSRATFCYIDGVANDRAEVVRPWTRHGRIADSYFFWRLLISILTLTAVLALAIPIVLSVVSMANAGEAIDPWRLLFSGGVMVSALPALVVLIIAYHLVRVFLNDFIAPIQYARGIPCGEAFKVLRQIVLRNPGAFLLYLVMRLLIWLVLYFSLMVLGCATCCILFCCWAIPVIGQAVLQPFHVFMRCFSLCFLQGFGPGFDVFPGLSPAPASGGGAVGQEGGSQAPGSVESSPEERTGEKDAPPPDPREAARPE